MDKHATIQPATNLHGEFCFDDAFRPIPSTEGGTFTDKYGYQWKQETTGGWRRQHDKFFIPMGPLGPYYNHNSHSVEAIKKQRANY